MDNKSNRLGTAIKLGRRLEVASFKLEPHATLARQNEISFADDIRGGNANFGRSYLIISHHVRAKSTSLPATNSPPHWATSV